MAIWRGPGGSGDATADSANTAQVAETFATQAGVSAAAAASSANAASASASAASAAQTAAETAQTAAETAETNAETAETNAETAQTAAEAAQAAAEAAQTAAELAETNAETAETNAEAAQTAAEAAQLAAENAQTAAELAETNAETAETGAVAAQLAAESARDSALAAYDNFDDRYLGAKTADPTLDNDGDALVAGSLYFNSVDGAMRVYTGSVWVDAYADGQTFLAKVNNLSDLPNVATARQNLDLEIGVDVQAFDATILKSADIGVTVQGYDADTAKYDDATANFTGTLQNGGSNVLVDTDIGSTVQAYDATIVVDADIGVTVQGYDADTAKYDDVTANFTGTLQNGGSNVLVDTDIGVTVQGYDADTAKLDVAQSFTAKQTFDSNIDTDQINEKTSAAGVTIDGVLLKDTTVTANTIKASGTSSTQGEIQLFEDTDNGTNYVAIKAPASIASNVTWTFPNADGTANQVLKTDGSGVLGWVTPSGGKVLQVVTVIDDTNSAATTGTTLIDTGLAGSITPTAASSKILVLSSINNMKINGTCNAQMDLQRQIGGGGYSTVEVWEEILGYADNTTASLTPWYIDTPNTTSQIDYKFRFAKRSGTCTVIYQNRIYDGGIGASNLILMEIAA